MNRSSGSAQARRSARPEQRQHEHLSRAAECPEEEITRKIMAREKSGKQPGAARSAKNGNGNGANLGFEAQLFLAADKLRGNLEPSDCPSSEFLGQGAA
jgi:hypothetical protein